MMTHAGGSTTAVPPPFAQPAERPGEDAIPIWPTDDASAARRLTLRERCVRLLLRALMGLHPIVLQAAGLIGRVCTARKDATGASEVLLTGTFHSANWLRAHLTPLAAARNCRRVHVVSSYPVPSIPGVQAHYPPDWLVSSLGAVVARMLTFMWVAVRVRPAYVGGFHLLINGLVAAVVARVIAARSIYFCVGGPLEVVDGGVWAENRLFAHLGCPDPVLERRLVRTVDRFDLVITMGTRAVSFFRSRGLSTRFEVISGGIDPERFFPPLHPPEYDLILVGRLAPIKRVDIFLEAVARVAVNRPTIRAVIVGDGPERPALVSLCERLGLGDKVDFVGQQTNIGDWLRKARLFVLTSDSEGLALSLMEAMSCGLPAVVSQVGDLPDLLDHGINGYLVSRRDVEGFARRIAELLTDEDRRRRFSAAALERAARYRLDATTRLWEKVL